MNPQHASTPHVTVSTPSSSSSSSSFSTTLSRKRRLSSSLSCTSDTTPAPWKDPSFRSSCKKRFLEKATTVSAVSSPPSSIDLLRHVVRDELQLLQDHCEGASNNHNHNNNMTQPSPSSSLLSGRDHSIPCAHHYLDDDELYDLLLEMEQEFQSNPCSSEPPRRVPLESCTTTATMASTTTAVFMTDGEEDMYYQTVQQYENDVVQDQIMDYDNEDNPE